MARTIALALAFLTMLVGEAQATTFQVVVVPTLDFERLDGGAIGLLVPGAGPETSAALARAALVRGEVRNSLRNGLPEGPPLISINETSAPGRLELPVIIVVLPEGGEQPNDRRYPIAILGDGFEGLLVSDSTRIPGLVSIADIAPTALGQDDGLTWQMADDPAGELLALDQRISENGDSRLPATL